MVQKKSMAAKFTEVPMVEMETFLKRAFRALHPKKSVVKGEVVFDLFITPETGVRVWTSIGANGEAAADVGQDAIRVQLYSFQRGRPLMPGKAPIVKRTQGWKDNLKNLIEDMYEKAEDKAEDIAAGRFIVW